MTTHEAQMSLVIVLHTCTNSAVKHPRNFNYSAEHLCMRSGRFCVKICQCVRVHEIANVSNISKGSISRVTKSKCFARYMCKFAKIILKHGNKTLSELNDASVSRIFP